MPSRGLPAAPARVPHTPSPHSSLSSSRSPVSEVSHQKGRVGAVLSPQGLADSSKKAWSQGPSLRRETQRPLHVFASLSPLGSLAWAGGTVVLPLPEASSSPQAGRDRPESEGPGSAWAWRQGVYTRVQACLRVSPRSKSSPEVTWRRRPWRKAAGWQGTPSRQAEWSQGGHSWEPPTHPDLPQSGAAIGSGAPATSGQAQPSPEPRSQQWILGVSRVPQEPLKAQRPLCVQHLPQLPGPPQELSASSLQFKELSGYFLLFLLTLYIKMDPVRKQK